MTRKSQGTRENESHKPQELPGKFSPGIIDRLDGRTELAKALKQNRDEIMRDIGELSLVKGVLVDRFVFLTAVLENLEYQISQSIGNKMEHVGKWIQAINALSGLAKTIGLDRKTSKQPWIEAHEPGIKKK